MLILHIPIFWSVQMPPRRKIYICCVVTIGGAAVILGFIRINSLRILSTNTHTSDGAGEMMVVAALGMSLAAIAHNLPSLRVFWKHIMKSRTKTKNTLCGPFELNSQDKLHPTSKYKLGSPSCALDNVSRPKQSLLSVTSLTERPQVLSREA